MLVTHIFEIHNCLTLNMLQVHAIDKGPGLWALAHVTILECQGFGVGRGMLNYHTLGAA